MKESCSETLRNEEIRRCGVVDIAKMRKARLRWYGHVIRRSLLALLSQAELAKTDLSPSHLFQLPFRLHHYDDKISVKRLPCCPVLLKLRPGQTASSTYLAFVPLPVYVIDTT